MKKFIVILIGLIYLYMPISNAVVESVVSSLRVYKRNTNILYTEDEKNYYADFTIDYEILDTDFIKLNSFYSFKNSQIKKGELLFTISYEVDGVFNETRFYSDDFYTKYGFDYSKIEERVEEGYLFYIKSNMITLVTRGIKFDHLNIKYNKEYYNPYNNSIEYLYNPEKIELTFFISIINPNELPYIDTERPYFTSNENIYTEITNSVTITDIKNGIRAYDDFCGDLSGRCEILDTNYNPLKCGDYFADIKVTDDYENSATKRFYIHVVDFHSPVIEGINLYNVGIKKYITIEEILEGLNITDNSNGKITLDIKDDYTPNKNKAGKYEVIVKAIDETLNSTEFVVTVIVSDDVPPIVTCQNQTVFMSENKTIDDLKKFEISDNETEKEKITLLYESNFNGSKKGEYEIICHATDLSGNESSNKSIITLIDDVKPTFIISNDVFEKYLGKEELYKYFNRA